MLCNHFLIKKYDKKLRLLNVKKEVFNISVSENKRSFMLLKSQNWNISIVKNNALMHRLNIAEL